MTRRIRIWAAFLALTCLLAAAMPAKLMTAFAANGRIAFSDPSGSVGSQITVNMEITDSENLASADVMLAYDSNVLEFVSGTNAEGGAGAIRVHGDGGTPNTTKLRFTLTFNALAAGTTKITVTSQEVYDSNSQLVTIERQGDSTVTVGALSTASNDATLRSLQVSPGTLTPAFSPDVDTYAVTVGTDVDKLIVSAECANENATNVVSGNENLQMGENRVTCQVTAQDGETVKEYVIVVTKAEGGASADTSQAAGFPMRVSERTITVLEPDASVEIPEGFVERTIRMDGNEVTGWVWGSDEDPEYCVIYGRNEAGETNFYRYDMKDTERTLQRYFADPAIADSVSQEVYDELAVQYDSLRSDFNLFRILLIAAIVIALVLLVLLVVVAVGKGSKRQSVSRGGHPDKPELRRNCLRKWKRSRITRRRMRSRLPLLRNIRRTRMRMHTGRTDTRLYMKRMRQSRMTGMRLPEKSPRSRRFIRRTKRRIHRWFMRSRPYRRRVPLPEGTKSPRRGAGQRTRLKPQQLRPGGIQRLRPRMMILRFLICSSGPDKTMRCPESFALHSL